MRKRSLSNTIDDGPRRALLQTATGGHSVPTVQWGTGSRGAFRSTRRAGRACADATEQSTAEQSRAAQHSRAEQSRAEHSRAEQGRVTNDRRNGLEIEPPAIRQSPGSHMQLSQRRPVVVVSCWGHLLPEGSQLGFAGHAHERDQRPPPFTRTSGWHAGHPHGTEGEAVPALPEGPHRAVDLARASDAGSPRTLSRSGGLPAQNHSTELSQCG